MCMKTFLPHLILQAIKSDLGGVGKFLITAQCPNDPSMQQFLITPALTHRQLVSPLGFI